MLEKLLVVFLTVKCPSENCLYNGTMDDNIDSPNLEDKQATISHDVHGRGQTSTEDKL